ncbi:probable arginine--tRNA ligase, mitochondrial [Apostichopus japonicus]|uniref:probable arginine--tRNA ligase, mitochondrial n=1 Tax=Stichopus japonicus TaxID=307972 RepID=UPI003AB7C641
MTGVLRRVIAIKLSKVTGLTEATFLRLIKPLPVLPKKGYKPALTLPLQSLHNELFGDKEQLKRRTSQDELVRLGRNVAKQLSCIDHIQNVSVEKQHLSFQVSVPEITQTILQDVHKQGDQYGFQPKPWQQWKRKKIVVEFSSPNIAKPFHAGHLRSTLIGHFVANLCSQLGHDVVRLNYLGDWGTQFGLLAVGFQKYGSVKELSQNPIQHLFNVYVKINSASKKDPKIMEAARKFFTAMEQGDEDSLAVWKRFREFSIKEYISTYQKLGIGFDAYQGESQYGEMAQDVLSVLREQSLIQKSEEGTSVMDLSDYLKSMSTATLAKSDGSSLYLTRDVAAAIDRHQQYRFHRMIYVVDKSQENHLKQLTAILKKMQFSWAEGIEHVPFGRVLGMQTRTGDVVLLEDILEEVKNRMLERMKAKETTKDVANPEDVAQCLGISALILQDLKASLISDYKFDWERILESQGDTGVFLQYTHARLKSIEANYEYEMRDSISTEVLSEPEAEQLIWHIAQFDDAVQNSFDEMEPKHIVAYILRLSRLASRAAQTLRVRGSERNLAESRLHLLVSARKVLSNGMRVLGMRPLDEM